MPIPRRYGIARFELGECATSATIRRGRAQAAPGEALKRAGSRGRSPRHPLFRCARPRLAFGRSRAWAPLSNLFGRQAEADKQVRALRPRIAAHRGKDNLMLVSHGSTALALTGEHPAMGEVLVLTPAGDGFRLAGRLAVQ